MGGVLLDREPLLADITAFHDRMWELYVSAMATCETAAMETAVALKKVMEKEGKVLTRFFCIECYRLIDGRWRLFRETVEHAGA
ncbi:MAG: hypothetical protein K0R39_2641 [Symbiobacteriaceae bacterium]|jgi:hypothetical protein|nr:hypothetical protein [Symbiobacteriaceae bacterium]